MQGTGQIDNPARTHALVLIAFISAACVCAVLFVADMDMFGGGPAMRESAQMLGSQMKASTWHVHEQRSNAADGSVTGEAILHKEHRTTRMPAKEISLKAAVRQVSDEVVTFRLHWSHGSAQSMAKSMARLIVDVFEHSHKRMNHTEIREIKFRIAERRARKRRDSRSDTTQVQLLKSFCEDGMRCNDGKLPTGSRHALQGEGHGTHEPRNQNSKNAASNKGVTLETIQIALHLTKASILHLKGRKHCRNRHHLCARWANVGECNGKYSRFMKAECCRSCTKR